MKVGVIGAGYWGRKHVEEYLALGHEVIVSDLLDSNIGYCESKGAECVKDYERIVSNPEVKAVSVCTPNATHYAITKELLAAGKSVLTEKPLALSFSEASELAAMARKKKLLLGVGHLFRFNNAVRKAKEIIDSGRAGRIRLIKIRMVNREFDAQPDFHTRIAERDVVIDLGPHAFDLVNVFSGSEFKLACGVGGSFHAKPKVDSALISGTAGGALVFIELSWVTPPKERSIELVCDKTSLFVQIGLQEIKEWDGRKLVEVPVEKNNVIRSELEAFVKAVREGNEFEASGEAGAQAVGFMEKVRESLVNVSNASSALDSNASNASNAPNAPKFSGSVRSVP